MFTSFEFTTVIKSNLIISLLPCVSAWLHILSCSGHYLQIISEYIFYVIKIVPNIRKFSTFCFRLISHNKENMDAFLYLQLKTVQRWNNSWKGQQVWFWIRLCRRTNPKSGVMRQFIIFGTFYCLIMFNWLEKHVKNYQYLE